MCTAGAMERRPLIVGITGMPGAGKTTAAGHLARMNYDIVSMGDVIREEVRRRGLKPGLESQLKVMELVRGEYGPAALAVLLEDRIRSIAGRAVVIDGIRSPEEIAHLRGLGRVMVLAVHASPARRFEYLKARGRHDDPHTWEEFHSRDSAELALRIGDVIAMADGMIVNEGISMAELGARAAELVESWVEGNGSSQG
jgi:dephospho-CoA kinase